ncbi:MAG: GNAT family N-acetyltransferase [Candidatus Heimdallarchaeota archaeon]|nr:GNAT family N-acetyltransferase [Candidatus Heimdallarchaeota archaeon]
MLNYKLVETDFKTIDEPLWNQYYTHFALINEETFPGDDVEKETVRRKQLSTDDPNYNATRYLIMADQNVIGYAFYGSVSTSSPEFESNGHHVEIYISLDKEYRRNGIATDIFETLKHKAINEDKRIITAWIANENAKSLCRKLGGEKKHEHFVNKLLMEDVNWKKMEEWIREANQKAPDVTIEQFTDIPETDIDEFCNLYTETINQAPWGGQSKDIVTPKRRREDEQMFKDRGYEWTTMISREQNGRISGLTEILYTDDDNNKIQQELTGVREQYRGRGLGKLLKATMLKYIRDTYPHATYISTGNAVKNAPMLAINTEMGYKSTVIFNLFEFEI